MPAAHRRVVEEFFNDIEKTFSIGFMTMRIYLMDRNVLLCQTLREFLMDLGHDVSVASSFNDLLALMGQPHPEGDLLLLGWAQVHGTLLRLLRDLHRRCANLPVVIVIDTEAILPVEEAVECGVYGYLRKPIRLAELELLLVRLADRRQAPS